MKKFLICVAAALLLCGGCLYAGHKYIDNLLSPENIRQKSAKTLGAPINLAQAPKWSLFPPTVVFTNLNWEEPWGEVDCSVTIQEGKILLKFWPLIQGQIKIYEISLDKPELTFKNKNRSVPIRKPQTSPPGQTSDNSAEVAIEKLIAKNGRLSWDTKNDPVSFANINLSVENLGMHEEADIKCDFSIVTPSRSDYSLLTGNAAIKAKARYYAPNLTIRSAALTFTPADQNAPISSLNLTLNGALDITSQKWKISQSGCSLAGLHLTFSGAGDFSQDYFSGKASLEYKAPQQKNDFGLAAESPVIWSENILKFPDIAIKPGKETGRGALRIIFPESQKPLVIAGDFKLGHIAIPENLPAKNADAPDAAQKNNATGAKPNASYAVSWPHINLNAEIASVAWLKFKFNNIKLNLTGESGLYNLKNLHFNWAGGTSNILGELNFAKNNSFNLQMNADKINLGDALLQLGINGVNGGTANLTGHFTGQGLTRERIIGSLNGNTRLAGNNASIKILKEINSMLPLLHNSKFAIPEKVEKISASCVANKGIFYCRPIRLESQKISCEAQAQVNLRSNSVDGSATLNAFGTSFPFIFKGSPDDISWHTGPSFLDGLRKLFP